MMVSSYSSAAAQESGPVYIVQSGDTLTAIARTFGTTVDALAAVNRIADPSSLFPGMELIIPGYEGVSGILAIRRIEYGETLFSLSWRYGIEVNDLARLNRLTNPSRLYASQPMVITEAEANPKALPQSTMLLSKSGESKLELAARMGVNPWSLRDLRAGDIKTWSVPGMPLVLPGGERPTKALPEPILSVEIDPLPAVQGHTLEVRLDLEAAAWAEGRLGDRSLNFLPTDSTDLVALQGIYALDSPGLYDLEIRLYDTQDGDMIYAVSQPIRVQDGGYGFENINGVPPQTVDPAIIQPEQEQIEAALSQVTPDKLWEGAFQFPTDYYTGSFLSVFGTRRSYNWGALSYYHTGLDFYGGTGVPILAAARGRVAYTGEHVVRGNVTYIDHGWGVYSGYFHQSAIYVSVGDLVEPGQVIGEVGGTGRSTGPHLHWEVWVGGVPVDPIEWVEKAYP
jgi:murein DD-endopeptidase MepM/ murein hydrolase activator NlpD